MLECPRGPLREFAWLLRHMKKLEVTLLTVRLRILIQVMPTFKSRYSINRRLINWYIVNAWCSKYLASHAPWLCAQVCACIPAGQNPARVWNDQLAPSALIKMIFAADFTPLWQNKGLFNSIKVLSRLLKPASRPGSEREFSGFAMQEWEIKLKPGTVDDFFFVLQKQSLHQINVRSVTFQKNKNKLFLIAIKLSLLGVILYLIQLIHSGTVKTL